MKNKSAPKCLLLWHGTSGTDPSEVYKKDGLNIAYSNDRCIWGRGIYFAVNASYSCPSYSFKVNSNSNFNSNYNSSRYSRPSIGSN